MQKNDAARIGARNWTVILVTGLAGQLCWHVENQWFNTFVYAKIAPDPDIISRMVVLSAFTGVLATVFFGTLSDRAGRRRPSMAAGYILWGVSVVLFGFTEYLRSSSVALAAALAVAADCVMTFFGSMAHDAGFNPWTSDITNERNRGALGAVIAVLPVGATIIGSLLFGNVIEAVDYTAFFFLLGGLMVGVGVFTLLFLKDSPDLRPNRDPKGFWHQFLSFFDFKPLRQDPLLLWVLVIFAVYFIGFQMYFTHIGNYLIYSRGYATGMSGVLMGVGLLGAAPFTFLAGRFLDRGRHFDVMNATVLLSVAGLLVIGFENTPTTVLAILLIGAGYMCIFQTLMVMLKNLYPAEARAQCEGLRCVFYVLIPMCIGTPLGSYIIKTTGVPTVNEYGIAGYAAAGNLFTIAAAWMLLTFIPIHFARKAAAKAGKAQA